MKGLRRSRYIPYMYELQYVCNVTCIAFHSVTNVIIQFETHLRSCYYLYDHWFKQNWDAQERKGFIPLALSTSHGIHFIHGMIL